MLEVFQLALEIFILIDEFLELECLLIKALGSILLPELSKLILKGLIFVCEFFDFLFKLRQFILFGFEEFFRGSDTFYLIFFLLALKIGELTLIDLNELINIMQFLFD